MTAEETAEIVESLRQIMQQELIPELRAIRAELHAMSERMQNFGAEVSARRSPLEQRMDGIERQVSVYQDVQLLKKQMAELRARQKPSA